MWLIDYVSPQRQTVFLSNPATGMLRQISVPGALVATIENGKVLIQTSTGWTWEVEPETGARRRFFAA
jgi:hypothetical protein